MKLLSWNCRGLGNPTTVRALNKILQREQPEIIFLMETKLLCNEMRRLNSLNWKYKGCFTVDCELSTRSRRGGLSMLWHESVDLHLISFSLHHILCKINGTNGEKEWFCTGIYGWPEGSQKFRTWALLESIKNAVRGPWICAGDFNEILWSTEKRGGQLRTSMNMNMFRDALRLCNLCDLGYTGNPFSWSNGRKGLDNILERIDRAVATPDWRNLFPCHEVRNLPRYKSDHSPLLVTFTDSAPNLSNRNNPRCFRMEHMWLQHPNFKENLDNAWERTTMGENIMEKLQICGAELMHWANKEFGNVKKKKKELYERLRELQQIEQNPVAEHETRKIELELDEVLKNEETMWLQRSRAIWLQDGDRNTKFFHQKATNRKRRNTIQCIQNERGESVTKFEDIVAVVRNYFIQVFSHEAGGDDTDVLNALECKVTPDINKALTKDYSTEEVLQAIKQMHPAKAPGPDGMTPLFFQKFWSMCKNDVLPEILGILNHGRSPRYINHTHVVLIPKIKKPKTPKDFRPISLANVIARILTKTIANRLKSFLPHIISDSQSAFIPGRLITDNAMTAFEIFHTMKHKKKGKKGILAMKLDMSKAYDRVEWNFLENVLKKVGFCKKWVDLVMSCVRTVSYSVLINRVPTDIFNPERGLRQGDPISPFLFLFCAEAFSALLKRAEMQGSIHGVKVARSAPAVSHLFFADDTILFTRATEKEAREIKQLITSYELASGQRINLNKTEITVSPNVPTEVKEKLRDILEVEAVEQHHKYLGLPTLIGKRKKEIFAGTVERILQKMKDWKEQSLSQAGRVSKQSYKPFLLTL